MAGPEPIAIVGMGCRLPGNVNSPSDLWRMLQENRSAQGPTPPSRWNVDAFYDPEPEYGGTLHHQGGYFIEGDIRHFDNEFFGINNLEAVTLDPGQRNLLEVAYQSLESGGIRLEDIAGRNIGCYVGNFTTDYINISMKDPSSITRYGATGIGTTILANRISHVFNLAGPSFVLDTACSSSIYALHNACLALQAGEIEAALVCGTNLLLSPEQQIATVKAGVLSPTGTCHAFDNAADGYGRADGVGVLFVKRLGDAIRDRDPVRSIVRGTALNCNGRTFGITLPSIQGQEAVIRAAYKKASLEPSQTDYVECHGTGTKVGDPIEVEALSRVFSRDRVQPLLLGSVKTNIGHSEAASGIASVIKSTLMLESGFIPPTHGVKKINPSIKTDEWSVKVVTEYERWPGFMDDQIRRISINSFGYGGANAHAVLENAGMHDIGKACSATDTSRLHILPISAKTRDSLARRASSFTRRQTLECNLEDLSYTLGCRRSFFPIRGFFLARQRSILEEVQIQKLVTSSNERPQAALPMTMIFTGQGAQWSGMAIELHRQNPLFRASIQRLDSHLKNLDHAPHWTIEQTLQPASNAEEGCINHPSRSQTVCTAVQIGLVDLFDSWRIKPQAVIGHSSGEIAAAYAARHITSETALAIAYYRGLVVSRNEGAVARGAMMAVGLSEQDAKHEIHAVGLEDGIRVACNNSPQSSTLSGREDAIDDMLKKLQDRRIFVRKLRTNGIAYHSYDMAIHGQMYESYISKYMQDAAKTKNQDDIPSVRMISTISGKEVAAGETRSPSYWRTNMETPVDFTGAVSNLMKEGEYHFVEIGPHSALELPMKQIYAKAEAQGPFHYASALIRGLDSTETTLKVVGNLFVSGHEIDFSRVNVTLYQDGTIPDEPPGKVLTDLPAYPWQHNDVQWTECRTSTEYRFRKHPRHELLGSIVPGGGRAGSNMLWRNLVKLKEVPWLADHRLEDRAIFPAAGYLAMAIEALARNVDNETVANSTKPSFSFRSVYFHNALIMPSNADDAVELMTDLCPQKISQSTTSRTWHQFEISSVENERGRWTTHASGLVSLLDANPERTLDPQTFNISTKAEQQSLDPTNASRWYEKFAKLGLGYGDSFQLIQSLSFPARRAHQFARSSILSSTSSQGSANPSASKRASYLVHPTIIDALLQTGLIADSKGVPPNLRAGLPASIDSLHFYSSSCTAAGKLDLPPMTGYALGSEVGASTIKFDCELRSAEGEPIILGKGIRMAEYTAMRNSGFTQDRSPILELVWKPDVENLNSTSFDAFLEYVHQDGEGSELHLEQGETARVSFAVIDLIKWKTPKGRVLYIRGSSSQESMVQKWLLRVVEHEVWNGQERWFVIGSLDDHGNIHAADSTSGGVESETMILLEEEVYDVLVFETFHDKHKWTIGSQAQQKSLISDAWILVLEGSEVLEQRDESLVQAKIDQDLPSPEPSIRLSKQTALPEPRAMDAVNLVTPDKHSGLIDDIVQRVSSEAPHSSNTLKLSQVNKAALGDAPISVLLLDLETSVLSTMTQEQMEAIATILSMAQTVLWVTGGDHLGQDIRPDMSLAFGFIRSMRLEYHPTKIALLDCDFPNTSAHVIGRNIVELLTSLQAGEKRGDDEWVLHRGLRYISRLIPQTFPSDSLGTNARGEKDRITVPGKDLGNAQLTIKTPGNLQTITLQQQLPVRTPLPPNHIEIDVTAVGLNAKDFYTLMGVVDTNNSTTSLECTGIIRAVGVSVIDLHPGDRVIVMAPSKMATVVRVPRWCCLRLLPHEDHVKMSTVPLVFASALYALKQRADLKKGESVLVHSATGGFGQAAIQVAKMMGAVVYATAGAASKRTYIHDVLGIPQNHIFDSRNPNSFEDGIMGETSERGVDVVLNSLPGELLHAGWRCMAAFGRFVELGKKDIAEAGSLDMRLFSRGATFSAFDLTDLYYSDRSTQQEVWSNLLQESIQLIREQKCHPIKPLRVFDLSAIKEAFQHFATGDRIGKVAIDFTSKARNDMAPIEVQPERYRTTFDSYKSYLLVGCLGGLGRHITRWMISRGARSFTFLSRSGTDKPAAQALIAELEDAGAKTKVIRGDVSSESAVLAAIEATQTPIGGVIQAAMTLRESLFSNTRASNWHSALSPKLIGTWNLHNALLQPPNQETLDFFLMTSSLTGTIGQAAESSYSAANSFLDAFARYRHSLGLPASTVALGAITGVGYLAEHPDAEAMLRKQGFVGVDEEYVLELIDAAIGDCFEQMSASRDGKKIPPCTTRTRITGLDVDHLMSRVKEDPRACILASSTAKSLRGSDASGKHDQGDPLPETISRAMADKNPKLLQTAVEEVVSQKLAALVQMPSEQITAQTKLRDIGMDSMLAVEARQQVTLGVDVPLVDFMTTTSTGGQLAKVVAEGLLKREAR